MQIENLIIAYTPDKGRGVYTDAAIAKETIIEESPVIVMTEKDRELLDQTLLHDYIFEWQPEGEHLCCMALGWIPVYNHSYTSNCEYFMNYENETMQVIAIRDIEAGEEVTINYNGDWNDTKPVWFEVKD